MLSDGFERLLSGNSSKQLRLMYSHRYPPVRVIIDNSRVMTDTEALAYRRNLAGVLSGCYVKTLPGESISYARFLTDALVLIHYVQYGIEERFRGASTLMRAFAPYFAGGEWYEKWKTEALKLLGTADIILYDFYKGTLRCRADEMALVSPGARNVIRVYRLPHQTGLADIDGVKRVIVRLGMPKEREIKGFDWPVLRPSQLVLQVWTIA